MKRLTLIEQYKLMLEYIKFAKRYGSYFDDCEMFYEFFKYLNIVRGKSISGVENIAQILAATGASEKLDLKLRYQPNYDNMRNYFDLDGKNIVEVSAGIVPVLSDKIARLHPTSTVTAIDPKVIPTWSEQPNLNTIRSKLNSLVNTIEVENAIASCDLLYATYPCGGTVPSIKEANERDIDLYLAMCGCNHGIPRTYEEYVSEVISYAKETLPLGRSIEIIRDEDIIGDGWPIIVTYKKKCR